VTRSVSARKEEAYRGDSRRYAYLRSTWDKEKEEGGEGGLALLTMIRCSWT